MRKLTLVVVSSLLVGLVGYAVGIEVKLPKRARARVVQVVDDVGDAVFGAKPARVEVTNFPAGQFPTRQLVTVAQDLPIAHLQPLQLDFDVSAYEEVSLLFVGTGQVVAAMGFSFTSAPGSDPGIASNHVADCNLSISPLGLGGCGPSVVGMRPGGPNLRISVLPTNPSTTAGTTLTVQAWVR